MKLLGKQTMRILTDVAMALGIRNNGWHYVGNAVNAARDVPLDIPITKAIAKKLVIEYWEARGGTIRKYPPKATKKDKNSRKTPSDLFYLSREWRELRYKALQVCGGKCQCCGASAKDGKTLHVDHIKPRHKHKHLQLDISNLQVLCEDCNLGKGAWDETDWRVIEQRQQLEHMRAINEKPI